MHATETLAEADRLMTICNSCRYCEGLCAVFPAMEMRRAFSDGDLDYLANLCHACGACYDDCQFSPPHDFNVNVPQVLAKARNESYARYAWPRALAPLFARNGVLIASATIASIAVFLIGLLAVNGAALWSDIPVEAGAFYRLMPHNVMAILFGAAFLYAILAIGFGVRAFWHDTGNASGRRIEISWFWRAIRDAGQLRYLDGGGAGCMNADESPADRRRLYHHFTFYGFLLCFASTSVATLYHYMFGRMAPYPWWDLPVILGALGGVGLVIGPIGLWRAKAAREPVLQDERHKPMDTAFIFTLFILGVTGLALLLLRATPAMGTLLALHLGAVFAFFITMPYGKFVHGIYRFAALVRYAGERDHGASAGLPDTSESVGS
jgi:citrate/tricarballylate utilization protein